MSAVRFITPNHRIYTNRFAVQNVSPLAYEHCFFAVQVCFDGPIRTQ